MSPAFEASLVFAAAWLLDASVGEPPAALHPVVWIGKLAGPLTRSASRAPQAELCWGALYLVVLGGGAPLLAWLGLRALAPWPLLRCGFEVYVLFSCFALKGLLDAGGRVRRALLAGDVPGARVALGSLCSRDAAPLSAPELAGAALESVTENSSDSVVAPLFYYALFGLPGAVCYRAVNTLDAMIGYRGRFEYLGKPAARLDDLLNFVPARLTAGLLWLTGTLLGLSSAGARAVFWRDRNRTESPNAGQVMAMAAGLLGVRLDKRGAYVLGAELAAPDAAALASAIVLVRSACWLFAALLLAGLLHWEARMGLSSAERVHGGLDAEELCALGLRAHEVIDFSVNINPYGPCRPLLEALRAAPLDAYPDPRALGARRAWADLLDTSYERIAVGHGAADLFWAIARALLRPGQRVLIAEPTFSEFRVAAQAAGAILDAHWAREEDDFRFDLSALQARAAGAAALYLCCPNNPTGAHLPASEIAALARALPGTWLVLDQSFLALSEHASEACASLPDNVLCVRSLTKDFALPGLRIGLLIAARALLARVEAARPTWSTSAPAQAAIEAAAREQGFVRESYAKLRGDRAQLVELLAAAGYTPRPAASSVFQLLRVGDAARFRRRLLLQGIALRDCSSFGLPDHVRIAVRPARDLELLRAALSS